MLTFLAENWGTLLVAAILIAVVVLVVFNMRKDKKAGKSCAGCGDSCESCSNSSACHK